MAKGVIGAVNQAEKNLCKKLGMNGLETRRAQKTLRKYRYDVAVLVGRDAVEWGIRSIGTGIGCLAAKGYFAVACAVTEAKQNSEARKSAKQIYVDEVNKIREENDEDYMED